MALKRCVAAFNGRGDYDFNADEELAMMHTVGNLFSAAAAAHPDVRTKGASSPSADVLTTVYKKVDPDDVLDDEAKRNALSEQEQCNLYTRMMDTLATLPPEDAATVLRVVMGA